jgi:hypothetical protein
MNGKRTPRFRRLLVTLMVLVAMFGSAVLAWRYFESEFYKRALPSQIAVSGFATIGSDLNRLVALVPMRHEGCGGALFRLSDATRASIAREGIAFFRAARQGRGYPDGHPDHHYYSYAEWRETPATDSLDRNSAWLGLGCMGLDGETSAKIDAAARQSGSYFTTMREAVLLVIPGLGIAVVSYFG